MYVPLNFPASPKISDGGPGQQGEDCRPGSMPFPLSGISPTLSLSHISALPQSLLCRAPDRVHDVSAVLGVAIALRQDHLQRQPHDGFPIGLGETHSRVVAAQCCVNLLRQRFFCRQVGVLDFLQFRQDVKRFGPP